MHKPADTNVNTPPDVTVHTPAVAEVKDTGKPEFDVAVNTGDVPKFWAPGLSKVMVWLDNARTGGDSADALDAPTLFTANTTNRYVVPSFITDTLHDVAVNGEHAELPVETGELVAPGYQSPLPGFHLTT